MMKLDRCLILCAGYGSRMGQIGRVLPKPLWPIFSKRLLDYQISLAKLWGVENIYINVFHCKHAIFDFYDKNYAQDPQIHLIEEDQLLGSGGAIHNLASLPEINYQGTLLILNSDVFLMTNEAVRKKAIEDLFLHGSCLIGTKIEGGKYNSVEFENNYITGIGHATKKDGKSSYTYSGVGLVDLSLLRPTEGVSRFFSTVADYKERKIYFEPLDNLEYWDFGTLDLYVENIKDVLSRESCSLYRFLLECKGIYPEQVGKNNKCYGKEKHHNVFNFTNKALELEVTPNGPIFIFKEEAGLEYKDSGCYFGRFFDPISGR